MLTNSTDTLLDSRVRVECEQDFRLEGTNVNAVVSRCNQQGFWDPPLPACIGKPLTHRYSNSA